VQQKFLRKKYKDPVTNDDFVPLGQANAAAQRGAQPGAAQPGRGQPGGAAGPGAAVPGAGVPLAGGIIGVTSKSTDESIRLYKGRSHYNEWAFVYTPPAPVPGAVGAPGAGGGRGQGQPGQNLPGAGGGIPGRGGFGPGGRGGPNGPGRGNFPPGQPQTITLPNGRTATFNPGAGGQPNTVTTGPARGR